MSLLTGTRRALLRSRWSNVSTPTGFDWANYPVTIQRKGMTFRVKEDVGSFAPTGTAYYVDGVGGNDGDAGTIGAPLKTLGTALAKGDIVVMYVKPSIAYGRTLGFNNATITKNLAIRRWPGETGRIQIHGGQDDLVWVLDGVLTNTYKATRSGVTRVVDLANTDADGYVERLTLQADAATVDANPGSWYLDGSNVLWVRTSDDRAPDSDICPRVVKPLTVQGDVTFYMEYCDIFMPNVVIVESTAAAQTPKAYFKDCGAYHGIYHGLWFEGVDTVICQDCIVAKNDQDGFNYHTQDSINPRAIEINCQARDNGIDDATANDNGSSMHDGGDIIRVGGVYEDNYGPNIIESNANTEAWMLGTIARNSAGQNNNYGVSASANTWLDRCTATGNTTDLFTGGTIYVRSCTYSTSGGGGSIVLY